jgi:hypothetical protein
MEITVNGTITLSADEALLKVLNKLAPKEEVFDALQKPAAAAIKTPAPVVASYYSTPITESRPTPAPCTAPVPVATVPIQTVPTAVPAAPSSPAVPTAAPTYQIEDLARASAQLMDAGKQPQLLALLQQFKVQGLSQLQPGQFGAFATALRGMGAKI